MRSHFVFVLLILFMMIPLLAGSRDVFAQYPGFDAPGGRTSAGSAAGLIPVNPTIDGGAVSTGGTAQVVVLFRNEGGQPVQTGKINLYPSSNVSAEVSLDQCSPQPLEPGAECALAISVKGLQAGPWRVELLMLHSGRTRLVTATLTGNVDASGDSSNRLSSDIETIPNEIDFGSLSAGQTMVEPVILRNTTSNTIKISDISIDANGQSGLSVKADCKELAAGEACIATVSWAPRLKGPSTGVLVVKHSGPTGVASVTMTGDYEPENVEKAQLFPDAVPGKGLIVSSQEEFDFGSNVETASTITVSLVNTGDSPVTLNDIKLSGTNNGLSLSSQGCVAGLVLQPIEACPLTLTWSPTRIGNVLDDIQILHDGARGVLVLPVRGTSTGTVSQNQKAIVLSDASAPTAVIGQDDVMGAQKGQNKSANKASQKSPAPSKVANASSLLDGLRITSFARTRAIINGPGGSRLVFNGQKVMLGGVTWDVKIQPNGIEFGNGSDHVLLLFDRSLSSINPTGAQSGNNAAGAGTTSASGTIQGQ